MDENPYKAPRLSLRTLLIVLALVCAGSILCVSYQAHRALVASHTLFLGRVTTGLVRDYVQKYNRWPQSWEDLRSVDPAPFDESGRFIDTARTRIVIDFNVTLRDLKTVSIDEFRAIRPRGYSPTGHKEYWEIGALLEECRSADARLDKPAQ